MYKKIAVASLIFILVLLNFNIYKREQHIKNGDIVFLKLAPVDPRSLMQGDYMALRFDVADKIYKLLRDKNSYKVASRDGKVVVKLNKNRVATFSKLYNNQKLNRDELVLNYRVRANRVKLATNAYFFEEGSGKKYEKAKYGEFRVNKEGELILVALADENVTVIK